MAYVPATSAPQLILQLFTKQRVWMYSSADTAATVDDSGYFTDGYARGMRDGDICLVYVTGTKVFTAHTVLNTSGTTIDLADGIAITTATNTN